MGQSPPPRTRVWIARSAYTYFQLPMIAGIIAVAAADELMVAHPGNRGTAASVALTIGGTALFFAGHALFKWAVFGVTPESIERLGLLVTPALVRSVSENEHWRKLVSENPVCRNSALLRPGTVGIAREAGVSQVL